MKGGNINDLAANLKELCRELNNHYFDLTREKDLKAKIILHEQISEKSRQLKVLTKVARVILIQLYQYKTRLYKQFDSSDKTTVKIILEKQISEKSNELKVLSEAARVVLKLFSYQLRILQGEKLRILQGESRKNLKTESLKKLHEQISETSNELNVLSETLISLEKPIEESISSESEIDDKLASQSKTGLSKRIPSLISRVPSFSRIKKRDQGNEGSGKKKLKKLKKRQTNKKPKKKPNKKSHKKK